MTLGDGPDGARGSVEVERSPPPLVPVAKITGYLLNRDHSLGRDKARYFEAFGFSAERPGALSDALIEHYHRRQRTSAPAGARGFKVLVRCRLRTPDGRDPCVLSVWMVGREPAAAATLVTCYPAVPTGPARRTLVGIAASDS